MITQEEKRNHFKNWRDTASVRKGQKPTDYGKPNGFWTSPDLVPVVKHPEVMKSGEAVISDLLASKAWRDQDFTEQLEIVVVVPLTTLIAQRKLERFDFDKETVTNARLIIIDECQHANSAEEIRERLATHLGSKTPEIGTYEFIQSVKAQQAHSQRETELVELGSVIVSETLITKGLVKLAKDATLDTGVSAFSLEHMIDEAGHHGYFAQLLKWIWHRLTHAEQAFFGGEVMPNAISLYLRLNQKHLYQDLQTVGFSKPQAERIVAETYAVEEEILQAKRDSAAMTLRHMKSAGMFEHPAVVAGLKANKLI